MYAFKCLDDAELMTTNEKSIDPENRHPSYNLCCKIH